MKIIYGYKNIKKFKNPVVVLGVFDGVHQGHRYILKQAVKKARLIRGDCIVVTFYPHPQKEMSLYSLKHRLRLIEELGVDVCIIIKFNRKFSLITADNFIKNILAAKIKPKYIYIGKNWTFGKSARGDYKLLDKLSNVYNYKLKAFGILKSNHLPISSTCIRGLIARGKLNAACKLLGRPVTVFGTVVKGISLAKKMGFPTANIDPHHEILPPSGVYLVKAIIGDEKFNGLCNIGRKPTLPDKYRVLKIKKEKHVEVHIFDFNKDIYGKDLEINFIRKLRDEKKFPSLNLLAAQIKKDILQARKILSR